MAEGIRVEDTRVVMNRLIRPSDVHVSGFVYGGLLMEWAEEITSIVSMRYGRGRMVTPRIEVTFLQPVESGDMVTVYSQVNYVGRSSLEVGVRFEAEKLFTGERRHVATAYADIVAMGPDNKPVTLPPLIVSTPEDQAREANAKLRRDLRREYQERKASTDDSPA